MKYIYLVVALVVVFSGCSSKNIKTRFESDSSKKVVQSSKNNNYHKFRYKPIIGTRQDDTKVMVDMGKFAKIWVKSYRNKNRTFVASHDIITMIKAPGFIVGEDLPRSSKETIRRSNSGTTFAYRSSDINHNSSEFRKLTPSDVKEFSNNYNKAKKYRTLTSEKLKMTKKYNSKLKEFLDEKRDN
jgi:hypothetical protein